MPLKKPGASGASESGPLPASWDASCLCPFSSLMEFLFSPLWADGSTRQLGTLQVSWARGSYQIKLKDSGLSRYAFFVADTLDAALQLADVAIQEGTGDWRKDEWAGKRSTGK